MNYIVPLNIPHQHQHGRQFGTEKVLKKMKITTNLVTLTTAVKGQLVAQFSEQDCWLCSLYNSVFSVLRFINVMTNCDFLDLEMTCDS